ncbi:hypothetical protein [Rhizobium ruizarguesonis]|uniref:hypothetical protein n=1 Tax=Rhizobium ruizarguesonis TaxID=2081791 RepID=UPI001030A003|nr:hypothetical protein [Rhizobium ruizarguesonis]TBB91897.1 hypothetical protein ELH38_07280 [Rhizobium ruizarguesonis]
MNLPLASSADLRQLGVTECCGSIILFNRWGIYARRRSRSHLGEVETGSDVSKSREQVRPKSSLQVQARLRGYPLLVIEPGQGSVIQAFGNLFSATGVSIETLNEDLKRVAAFLIQDSVEDGFVIQ